MASLSDYALPVHKSLQQPDLLLGVPKPVFAALLCATVLLIYLFGFIFALGGIVLYIPCYFISKEDPNFLVIIAEHVSQIEKLEG